jgi:hypothetical protein
METEKTFFQLLTGEFTPAEFWFGVILVLLGILLYTLVRIWKRTDKTQRIKFKVWLKHKDNVLELIISVLFIYPQVLFATVYQDWIMSVLPEQFNPVPYFVMFAGGYLQHYFLIWIKKKTK